MNGKKRSDKDLLHLGLPPMELAEPIGNVRSSGGLKKYVELLPKFIAIIILIVVAIGSYITLLGTLQSIDFNRNTEIIIVTGINDPPNATSNQSDLEVILHVLNTTSDSALKRGKRNAVAPTEIETELNMNKFTDEQMQKARKVVTESDVNCNDKNINEVCKDMVTQIKSIAKEPLQINKNEAKSVPVNAVSFDNTKSTSEIKHENDVIAPATDKGKRETLPVTHVDLMKSTPHMHFDGREEERYSNDPSHVQIPPQQLTDTCLLARLLKDNYPNLHGVYEAPAPEFLPQPFENQPLPYARYQMPPFVQGRESNLPRPQIHPQDAEIFMKFLTQKPDPEHPCNSTKREVECPTGTIPCNNGEGCVTEKNWCDGNVDCSDVSDEARCSCKSRVDKARICDGYFDCPFGEDEMGCFGCSEATFSCGDVNMNSQSTCFTEEQRCNNVAECPNHRDEIECTMLAPSLSKKPLFAISNTEGFLHRNLKGSWYPVCKNPYMWAHDACRRETGLIIRPPFIQMLQIDPMLQVTYLNTGPGGMLQISNTCFNSSAVYVTCPDLLCGTRVLSTSQLLRENAAVENELFGRNKRFLYKGHPSYPFMFYGSRIRRSTNNRNPITTTSTFFNKNSDGSKIDNETRNKRAESRVVGGRPSQPAAWPWVVAMYRDGMFHCGGVIITQRWVVSAAHCVQNFWEHYFEIQVGMLRRFSFSPQEQNHVVTHVIVNQQYSKVDMKNDLSLLRVKPAIIFSRWVRPICLPGPETAGADWKWGPAPGTMCIAVGWGATKEHGPDPDHMREVEIPIWARCKHQEDKDGKEICAGPVEGGKDACQGDSGGPLICKNPLNSQQWYMAGIVSHGDGCARKDEPGVYTRVSLFVKWIRHHVFSKTLPTIQPKQECPGFKCTSGISKCIPMKRVCDKIVDCLNGEDELNCSAMRTTHTFGDTFLASSSGDSNIMDKDDKTKEAETELPLVDKLSNGFDSSNTTEILTSTHVPATFDTSSQTRESSNMNENTEGNPNTGNILKPELDTNTASSAHKEKSVPEIDFAHASTVEMPNSKSSENSDNVSYSAEHITADPNRSTLSEEMERTNRGDMATFTVVNSKESLESRSSVSENRKTKEADIHEDWSDTDSSSFQNVDSFTLTPTMKTNINKADELTATVATSAPENHNAIDSNSLNQNSQNEHSSTLMDNKNSKPESKDFSVDLLPDTQSTISTATNKVPHTETLHMSNSGGPSAKIIENVEEKDGLIDKIKDVVPSQLQSAKMQKEHRIPKEFECRRILQSVPYYQRCNHKADCEDGTDELGCTCTDYLTIFDKNLICDGVFDCADGQDEIDCYTCPEDQFLCQRSQQCLPSKYVCDGRPQCPQGEDELGCFALSNGKNIVYDIDGRPKVNLEGYLTKKHINDWQIVCEDNMPTEKQELAATHICRYLGFSSANRYLVKYINVKEDEILKAKSDDTRSKRHVNEVPIHFAYRKVEDDTARHIVIKEPQVLKEQCVPNVTKTCMSLYVFCDQSLFTNVDVSQELYFNREVENTENMWPWAAKVYVEGDYRCTGVLIDLSWVLISHSCLWDTLLSHHITVVLGSQRTLSLTPGMFEQIYKVDAKKDLYHSKVALLHLKEQAHYSSMVKPMVLPTSNMQISSKSTCVALGQDNKNTTMSAFLQETSENCDLHSRCFKRLQKDDCSPGEVVNRPWAGIISCHTDQGWFPAASFVVAGGECRVDDSIIASEIENLRNEMRQYLVAGRSLNSKEEEASDECDGQRCGRGQCIKLGFVCDGVNDCHDGKDESEPACEKKQHICTKNPYHKGCECSTGQLKCHNGKCVAKELFKDGRDDCGDGSDEPAHMTCSHYLARVNPSRLCDGVLHCGDRSDEDPMYCKCFAKHTFMCPSVSDTVEHCVAPDMVCDGVRDCPDGGDERVCMGLSAPEGTAAGTGQVMIRTHGVWHSKCYPTPNHTKSELEDICKELGFIGGHAKQLNPPDQSAFRPSNNLILDSFSEVLLNNNTRIKIRNTNEPMARATVDDNLENCHPVFIECL